MKKTTMIGLGLALAGSAWVIADAEWNRRKNAKKIVSSSSLEGKKQELYVREMGSFDKPKQHLQLD